MRTTRVALMMAAVTMLVACVSTPEGARTIVSRGDGSFRPLFAPTQSCSAAACSIPVSIVTNPLTGNCIPQVDNLDISPGENERAISLHIVTRGYEFSKEEVKFAVFFKTPYDQFREPDFSQGRTTITIKFKKKAPQTKHVYAITVRRDSGDKAFCDVLDPWMFEI